MDGTSDQNLSGEEEGVPGSIPGFVDALTCQGFGCGECARRWRKCQRHSEKLVVSVAVEN